MTYDDKVFFIRQKYIRNPPELQKKLQWHLEEQLTRNTNGAAYFNVTVKLSSLKLIKLPLGHKRDQKHIRKNGYRSMKLQV